LFKYLSIIAIISLIISMPAWSALDRDIAIADFTNVSKASELNQYIRSIPLLIFTELAKSQKLSLVSRQELDKIMSEMELVELGVVDPSTAAKIGNAVGARYMIIGQLSKFQRKNGISIRITTQLVDVESIRVIAGDEIMSSTTELDKKAVKLGNTILRRLFPVSPLGAAGRSLIIPGWGQIANMRDSGYVFLSLTLLASGALLYTQYAYTQASDDYNEILNREHKIYTEFQDAQNKLDNRTQLRWIVSGTLAGIWLINVVDACIEANSLVKQVHLAESRAKLQTQIEPQNFKVVLSTRF
jgi:TolB-like protein